MFQSILGRLERLLLLLGYVEFYVENDPLNFSRALEKEGFISSESGIPISFSYWDSDSLDDDPKTVKVIYPSKKEYLIRYLDGDIIPPQIVHVAELNLPEVSLITPIYNSEKYFDRYLKQIINIDYPENLLEIIIVDDGSDDKESVNEFVGRISKIFPNVKFHRNSENKGVFFSKMIGSKLAEGKYLTFWDIDDLYDPQQIKLLAIHNELLEEKERMKNFLISSPSVLLEEHTLKPVEIWKTSYKEPFHQLIEGMLTLRGTISITSSLLRRNDALSTYETLTNDYHILELVPNLSIPEDAILVNQMIIDGRINAIFPISYTARGHVRGNENTSANLKRRVKEIPLMIAILIKWCCEKIGGENCFVLFKSNTKILKKSLLKYGALSKNFVINVHKYLMNLGGLCEESIVKNIYKSIDLT